MLLAVLGFGGLAWAGNWMGMYWVDYLPGHPTRAQEFSATELRREEVVRRLRTGTLPTERFEGSVRCGYARRLPPEYADLAADGEILIGQEGEVMSVLFFTRQGGYGDGAGFLYRSDDTVPPRELFGCGYPVGVDHRAAERVAPMWYWVWYEYQ